jgi:hypothetical protein
MQGMYDGCKKELNHSKIVSIDVSITSDILTVNLIGQEEDTLNQLRDFLGSHGIMLELNYEGMCG